MNPAQSQNINNGSKGTNYGEIQVTLPVLDIVPRERGEVSLKEMDHVLTIYFDRLFEGLAQGPTDSFLDPKDLPQTELIWEPSPYSGSAGQFFAAHVKRCLDTWFPGLGIPEVPELDSIAVAVSGTYGQSQKQLQTAAKSDQVALERYTTAQDEDYFTEFGRAEDSRSGSINILYGSNVEVLEEGPNGRASGALVVVIDYSHGRAGLNPRIHSVRVSDDCLPADYFALDYGDRTETFFDHPARELKLA